MELPLMERFITPVSSEYETGIRWIIACERTGDGIKRYAGFSVMIEPTEKAQKVGEYGKTRDR
ncbi:hypothetical protein [Bifidobacterium tsurumiense]|uniref:hypothetical protein n=1 Tax=Bifidobacterium tsurumiense TaxID=356829 RepID=UPI0018A6B17D|nr:hypothetical protein [Bifidobacterium tsurumiense]MDY4678291.1 hypothetical protein [Bifidobacterium tsurumiense]